MRSMRVTRSPLVRMPAVFTLLTVMALVVAGTVLVTGGTAEAPPDSRLCRSARPRPLPVPAKSVGSSDDGYVTASQPTARSGRCQPP